MSKKNYKKSRKYKKMRRRKIIFGIEITVLLILSGILFVYAWINRSMDKMNQDTLDSSQIQINSEVKANTDLSQMSVHRSSRWSAWMPEVWKAPSWQKA